MSEQVVTISQCVFAAIIIIAVFVVMVATMYFHARERDFSKETITF